MHATLSTPVGSYQIETAEGSAWLTSQRELAQLADMSQPDYRIPAIDRRAVR